MDLIYADSNSKDIGIINSYDMDMAYGRDENNFELSIGRDSHCCKEGYFIYVEGEEYGGVVDIIEVDAEHDEITYHGRTWHGILEGKAIEPPNGQDYLIVSGEANAVLGQLINQMGLSDIFEASPDDSEIDIHNYQFERYIYGYTGIKKMLKESGAKLKIKWQNGKVILYAEYYADYSQDEEFDDSQIDFTVKRNYRPVNHMICLGQGDMRDRAVIHIFTDENGGVQPYAIKTEPLQDSDYILDRRNRILEGKDEVIEIYDYPNAEITTNYILLTSPPSDWERNCDTYYEIKNDKYKEVEKIERGYVKLLSKPSDWDTNCTNYYRRSGDKYNKVTATTAYNLQTIQPSDWNNNYAAYYDSSHHAVAGVETVTYSKQTKTPSDWKKNYGEYYIYFTDGVIKEYRKVSGVTIYIYTKQTARPTDWNSNFGTYYRNATAKELKKNKTEKYKTVSAKVTVTYTPLKTKPSDWNSNYGNYYRSATKEELKKDKNTKYKKVTKVDGKVPEFVSKKYYSRTEESTAPKWKKNTYYTRYSEQKAPKWSDAVRYTEKKTIGAPTWKANTYYTKVDNQAPAWLVDTFYKYDDTLIAPAWNAGIYYRAVLDRYAVMVEAAIEKLREKYEADELKIKLEETEQVYDIGDIVGAYENVTGIEVTQEIVKKIIKITNDDINISYEVN